MIIPKSLRCGSFGVGLAEAMAAFSIDGHAAYPGRQTQELVVQAHGHWKAGVAALATAAAAAPDEASAEHLRSWSSELWMYDARPHALPDFVPEAIFGSCGARLRESIEVYDFDRRHAVAKGLGMNVDSFMFGF